MVIFHGCSSLLASHPGGPQAALCGGSEAQRLRGCHPATPWRWEDVYGKAWEIDGNPWTCHVRHGWDGGISMEKLWKLMEIHFFSDHFGNTTFFEY